MLLVSWVSLVSYLSFLLKPMLIIPHSLESPISPIMIHDSFSSFSNHFLMGTHHFILIFTFSLLMIACAFVPNAPLYLSYFHWNLFCCFSFSSTTYAFWTLSMDETYVWVPIFYTTPFFLFFFHKFVLYTWNIVSCHSPFISSIVSWHYFIIF
jgi:hypothetical protein